MFIGLSGEIIVCVLDDVWVYRAGAVVAKYGDKSVYFDLEDLGNTTGQWDVYGSDAPSPYNSLQVLDLLPNWVCDIRYFISHNG